MKKKETNQFEFIELRQDQENKCISLTSEQLIQQYGLMRRDLRSLWTSQSFIQAHRNCIIAKFSNIPAIITINKMLLLCLDTAALNPFVQQFTTISQEIQQYQNEWELICLESILSFVYNRLNQQYLQVASKFEAQNIVGQHRYAKQKSGNKYKLFKNRQRKTESPGEEELNDLNVIDNDVIESLAYSQERLQELSIACTQLDQTLEGFLEDDGLIVRLCFKNQAYLDDNEPQQKKGLQRRKKQGDIQGISAQSELKPRIQSIQRQKSVAEGIGNTNSTSVGSGLYKTGSTQNLQTLSGNTSFLGPQQDRSAIPSQGGHQKGSTQHLKNKYKQSTDYLQDQYISVPYSLEALINQFELYKFQTNNLSVELKELEQKAALNVIEKNLKLEVQRGFLLSFSLLQKLVNVSMLVASIIGQFFGMNLLNPWRQSDGPQYSSSTVLPFIIVSIITMLLFGISFTLFTVQTAEIRNFEAKSAKRKQNSKQRQNNKVGKQLRHQRFSNSRLVDSSNLSGDYLGDVQNGKMIGKKGYTAINNQKRRNYDFAKIIH